MPQTPSSPSNDRPAACPPAEKIAVELRDVQADLEDTWALQREDGEGGPVAGGTAHQDALLERERALARKLERACTTRDRDELMRRARLAVQLGEDLAREFGVISLCVSCVARATGPQRPSLQTFFRSLLDDAGMRARLLANKIVALGGDPATSSRPVPAAPTNRDMLEAVAAAERTAMTEYTTRAHEARTAGDAGLATDLERLVADASRRAEEADRMIRTSPA